MSFFDFASGIAKAVASEVFENVDRNCDRAVKDERFNNLSKEKRDEILKAKKTSQQILGKLNK